MYCRPMVELPTHLRGAPMGEGTVSREELSRHQRARVIAKATPVFARRGYQTTTVDDLLAAAKVGVGSFYSLFAGKEECFMACFMQATEEAQGKVDAAVADAPDWGRSGYRGLAALLGYVSDEPLAARLVLVEAKSAGSEPMAQYDLLIARAVTWLTRGRELHPGAVDLPARFEQTSIAGLAFYLEQCLLQTSRPRASVLLAETAPLLLEPIVGATEFARIIGEGDPPVS